MGRQVFLTLSTGLQATFLGLRLIGFCSTRSVPPSTHPASTSEWRESHGRSLKWEYESRRKKYCNRLSRIHLPATPRICFTELPARAWLRCAFLKRPGTNYISSKPKRQEALCWDRALSRSGVITGPNRKSVRLDWRMAAAVSACSCSIFI